MLHSPSVIVVLAVLATARLSRLAVADAVLDRPRDWIKAHAGRHLAYFVQCPWCVSVWLGAGVAAATYAWHRDWWVQIPLLALAASLVAGLAHVVIEALEAAAARE